MQDGQNAKQLIVERVKSSTNILVTVGANPSVDALSAALGFTLMLNKMDKHATAVFSGKIPPAINFLDPGKTFESTVDSLRDFIIALDKEKADRLRYKVEGDLVRIFITPYRTTISEKDLQFSQGDFNVDLVVALGVEKREDLDAAIVAHGRILHDATVATINARNDKNGLGSIDWQDSAASSLCEMLMSLSEALQPGLLDQQISTSILTGIVAATDRFSNSHTSPRVMTMAAQLMAAGANQQLIATKLQETNTISRTVDVNGDGSTSLKEGQSSKVDEPVKKEGEGKGESKALGEMHVDHGAQAQAPAPPANGPPLPPPVPPSQPPAPPQPLPPSPVPSGPPAAPPPAPPAEKQLDDHIATNMPLAAPAPDLAKALEEEARNTPPPTGQQPADPQAKPSWMGKRIEPRGSYNAPASPPTMGGSLSATSEQALADKMREEEERRNHTLLSHDTPTAPVPAFNNFGLPQNNKPAGQSLFGDDNEFIETPITPRDNPAIGTPPPAPTMAPPPIQQAPPPPPSVPPAAGPPSPVMAPPPIQTPPPPSAPAGPPGPPQPLNPNNESLTLDEIEKRAHQQIAEAASLAAPAEQVANDLDNARQAVNAAFDTAPFNPANNPAQGIGAQPLPAAPQTPPAPEPAPAPQNGQAPPANPFGTTAQPPLPPPPAFDPAPPAPAPPSPDNSLPQNGTGPGTFRIPGQQ